MKSYTGYIATIIVFGLIFGLITWLVNRNSNTVKAPINATSTIATTTGVRIPDTGLQDWTDTRDKGLDE